jgi:hypothetical protein
LRKSRDNKVESVSAERERESVRERENLEVGVGPAHVQWQGEVTDDAGTENG